MNQEQIRKLPSDEIRKKIKIANFLLAICYPVSLISFVVGFTTDSNFTYGPAIGLLVICLAIQMGRKQGKEELVQRESDQS